MKIYRVGGYIRDYLLGLEPRDCDYVVIESSCLEMKALGYRQVGNSFPVFLHPETGEEYALARTEQKIGNGHNNFSCDSSEKITLEQDLLRRDITINAIAMSRSDKFIDPYNGIKDLRLGIIRHISAAFSEDPLRILRVARFAAKLNFRVAPETRRLLTRMGRSKDGIYISTERILSEVKLALSSKHSWRFFVILQSTLNLSVFFPNLAKLLSIGKRWDEFCYVLRVSSNISQKYLILALYYTLSTPSHKLNKPTILLLADSLTLADSTKLHTAPNNHHYFFEVTNYKPIIKFMRQSYLLANLVTREHFNPQNILLFYNQCVTKNSNNFIQLYNSYEHYLSVLCNFRRDIKPILILQNNLNLLSLVINKLKQLVIKKLIAHLTDPRTIAKTIKDQQLLIISNLLAPNHSS